MWRKQSEAFLVFLINSFNFAVYGWWLKINNLVEEHSP